MSTSSGGNGRGSMVFIGSNLSMTLTLGPTFEHEDDSRKTTTRTTPTLRSKLK